MYFHYREATVNLQSNIKDQLAKEPGVTTWGNSVVSTILLILFCHNHWVDTWWANGDVSPSQMAVVDRLDLKISDYIQ